ncbi:MAG TPA: cytidine deaminase [Caldilineaceae bacterium]|nr:cytidine deaminase [Caldilineaceae bacterium]
MISAEELVRYALEARQLAYAPYSQYMVGAAVIAADGTIVVGCNVENASYGATICAERVALTSAIAQGKRQFLALAVATGNGGSPCGLCRQVMAELGPDMIVYISDGEGHFHTTTVEALLPDWFTGAELLVGTEL